MMDIVRTPKTHRRYWINLHKRRFLKLAYRKPCCWERDAFRKYR